MVERSSGPTKSDPPVAVEHREAGGEALVASFGSYRAAQASLDALAERGFPVESARIVARDLILVEGVVGRITLARAAADGAWSGAAVGAVIGTVGHCGFDRHHCARVGSLEAGRYDVVTPGDRAEEARTLLAGAQLPDAVWPRRSGDAPPPAPR